MKKKNNIVITGSMLGLADLIAITALSYLCEGVFGIEFSPYYGLTPITFSVIYTLVFMMAGNNFELYTIKDRKAFDVLFSTAATCVIVGAFIMIVSALLFKGDGMYMLTIVLAVILIGMCIIRYLLNRLMHRIRGVQKLLVIENESVDNAFARKIKYSCLDWFDSWYVSVDMESEAAIDEFLKGKFKQYNNIFITQSIPSEIKSRIIDEAISDDKTIYFLPSMYDINITKYEMIQFADTPSFRIKRIGLNSAQRFVKRAFDIIASALGLIVLSPVFAAVAIAIKAGDGGSVMYSQERITRGGKPFNIYKFRTMVENAEKLSGAVLATENDPRITPVGRFLRATRLDEIPQLINILKGDMSVVGPRPERPKFVDEFRRTIPHYEKRHLVKAGLTGYAQVYSNYSTDVHDKLLYDLLYIREYSFLLDIKLMILTVKTVMTKEAAEGVQTQPVQVRPEQRSL